MKNSKKDIFIRLLITIIIILAIVGVMYLICHKLGYTNLSKEALRELIEKTGAWGPIVFIIISFLQVTFIPIPGIITILVGSVLFGPWLSILYSFIGIFLGSILAFGLGRWLGRKFVNWIMGDKETVDQYLNKIKNKEIIILFFMFLLPLFPDDALCTLAGITAISWKSFIIVQVVTRIISISATILFASGEVIPYNAYGFTIIGVIIALSIFAFIMAMKNANRINDFFAKIGRKKDENKNEKK